MKINDNILELAVTQAHKSPMNYRHGAVIWKGKKILGTGYNYPVAPPNDNDKRRFSIRWRIVTGKQQAQECYH